MKIECFLNEKDHKVFLFITTKYIYIREWIGHHFEDGDYGVLRVGYFRCPEDSDRVYIKEQYKK